MRYVKIALLVIIVIAIGGGIFATMGSFGEGSRAGELYKFSKKGVIFKTYEGELSISSKGAIGEKWAFSVNGNDAELIKQMENSMGKTVTLHYNEKYVQMSWAGDTKYFITKVTDIR